MKDRESEPNPLDFRDFAEANQARLQTIADLAQRTVLELEPNIEVEMHGREVEVRGLNAPTLERVAAEEGLEATSEQAQAAFNLAWETVAVSAALKRHSLLGWRAMTETLYWYRETDGDESLSEAPSMPDHWSVNALWQNQRLVERVGSEITRQLDVNVTTQYENGAAVAVSTELSETLGPDISRELRLLTLDGMIKGLDLRTQDQESFSVADSFYNTFDPLRSLNSKVIPIVAGRFSSQDDLDAKLEELELALDPGARDLFHTYRMDLREVALKVRAGQDIALMTASYVPTLDTLDTYTNLLRSALGEG